MKLSTLEVFQSPTKKIRIGKQNDGGYIIASDFEYDCFLSAGISDDISFEEEFLSIHGNQITCIAYDGTINNFPHTKKNIVFKKENISPVNNMSEYINKFNNIFLKMDIEGHEYDWINSLTIYQLKNIKQIVIEFHLHLEDHWKEPLSTYCNSMIEKIKETHILIHFHPNNCGSCMKVDNQDVPRVFECTFLRKDCMNNIFKLSNEEIPGHLDQINVLDRPNIYLKGYPYNTL